MQGRSLLGYAPMYSPLGVRVLLADGDTTYREQAASALREAGFNVEAVATYSQATDVLEQGGVEVAVFDLQLAQGSAVDLCRILRQKSKLPVLMTDLTTRESEIISAFEAGADSWVQRPVSLGELTVRVAAVHRRATCSTETARTARSLRVGTLLLDIDAFSVRGEGQAVRLTRQEFLVLFVLVSKKETAVGPAQLFALIWDNDDSSDLSRLRTIVSRIRRKLRLAGVSDVEIRFLLRKGYMLKQRAVA